MVIVGMHARVMSTAAPFTAVLSQPCRDESHMASTDIARDVTLRDMPLTGQVAARYV